MAVAGGYGVEVEGEMFSALEGPLPNSKAVKTMREIIFGDFDLCLNLSVATDLVRTTCASVNGNELESYLYRILFQICKGLVESDFRTRDCKSTANGVLNDLTKAYRFLIENKEYEAISTLEAIKSLLLKSKFNFVKLCDCLKQTKGQVFRECNEAGGKFYMKHIAMPVLINLAVILQNAASFWMSMQQAFEGVLQANFISLANKAIEYDDEEKRCSVYQNVAFKECAVKTYIRCAAVELMCDEYADIYCKISMLILQKFVSFYSAISSISNQSKLNTETAIVAEFSSGRVPLPLYYSTIFYLQRHAKWEINNGRIDTEMNGIFNTLIKKDRLGSVTLVKFFSFFVLFLNINTRELTDEDLVVHGQKIKSEFFGAIEAILKDAQNTNSYPIPCILCPIQNETCSTELHTAHVEESGKHWICSKNNHVFKNLTLYQTMCCGTSGLEHHVKGAATASPAVSITEAVPTLPQLVDMNFTSRVAPEVSKLGTLLLKDDQGDEMLIIHGDCLGKQEPMVMAVLRKWLAGKGAEVSWESLITTVKKINRSQFAAEIEMALDRFRS